VSSDLQRLSADWTAEAPENIIANAACGEQRLNASVNIRLFRLCFWKLFSLFPCPLPIFSSVALAWGVRGSLVSSHVQVELADYA